MIMKNEIFKVGDRVYHIDYGWGLIDYISDLKDELHPIQVTFEHETMYFTIDGRYYNTSKNKSLSFTEYTLQGFSQERPIELPEVGELCLVRNEDNEEWILGKFDSCVYDGEYLYRVKYLNLILRQKQMKRIKILD